MKKEKKISKNGISGPSAEIKIREGYVRIINKEGKPQYVGTDAFGEQKWRCELSHILFL